MRRQANRLLVLAILMTVGVGACAKKQPPVARPMPPPANTAGTANVAPPPPPTPISEPTPVTVPPMPEDSIAGKSLDDLNRDSPLKPLFFQLDSSEVSAEGRDAGQDGRFVYAVATMFAVAPPSPYVSVPSPATLTDSPFAG